MLAEDGGQALALSRCGLGQFSVEERRRLPIDAAADAALDRLFAQRGNEIAAMLVEPRIQGAGGMLVHEDEVLRWLRRLADKHEVLLIFDEIFVGFGRTGDLFACEGAGVVPNIVTLSKALTGETLPLSARRPDLFVGAVLES